MSEGCTRYEKVGSVGRITFDRPDAYNALSWDMWRGLGSACAAIAADPEVSVVTLRGAGGKAFVSGTDIAGFVDFPEGAAGGERGLAYEAEMDSYVGAVERLPQPTIAIIDGWAVGGGLALSFASDFRIARAGSKFGSPLARTIGNCLSARGYARLVQHVGVAIAKRLLIGAEMITAEELHAMGLINALVTAEEMDGATEALIERLLTHAPLTMKASKEAIGRLSAANQPDIDDLIAGIYGSADFKEGVRAFLGKEKPAWQGR